MSDITTQAREMIERLENTTFVRVSIEDNPRRYYPTPITEEAAALIRDLLAERETHDPFPYDTTDPYTGLSYFNPTRNPTMPQYVLWSTRFSGWVSTTGTYTTELDNAKRFGYDEILAKCQRTYDKNNKAFGLIPVATHILEEIIK